MDTSLGFTRDLALGLRTWNNSGTAFAEIFRKAFNLAQARFAADVPGAFIPSVEHVVLLAPVDTDDPDDTGIAVKVNATSDLWVLRFTDAAGAALGAGLSAWRPTTNGTWDGIMHLEVLLPDGVTWSRRQSRNWWGSGGEFYVSLDRPWRNTTDTLMRARIHQPEMFTRADVMKIMDPGRIWDTNLQLVGKIAAGQARGLGLPDFRGERRGIPEVYWRGVQFQLPAPLNAPTTNDVDGTWVGPVQEGAFQFCYTYTWGYRSAEWQDSPGGMRDVQWESAPSPVSSSFDHSVGANAGAGIEISTTDVSALLNFNVTGTLRDEHSGWGKRIYVRRSSILVGGTAGAWDQVETSSIFYPLMDVAAHNRATVWVGSVVPEFLRRLQRSKGYYSWEFYPHQDARYEIDLPVVRYPAEVVDDQDTPPIRDDAYPAFMELILHYLSLLDGVDRVSAAEHLAEYKMLIKGVRSGETGSPAGVIAPASILGGSPGGLNYGRGRFTAG